VVYKSDKVVYMDDYAHHPSELKASISSIRDLYPGRKSQGYFNRTFIHEHAILLTILLTRFLYSTS